MDSPLSYGACELYSQEQGDEDEQRLRVVNSFQEYEASYYRTLLNGDGRTAKFYVNGIQHVQRLGILPTGEGTDDYYGNYVAQDQQGHDGYPFEDYKDGLNAYLELLCEEATGNCGTKQSEEGKSRKKKQRLTVLSPARLANKEESVGESMNSADYLDTVRENVVKN